MNTPRHSIVRGLSALVVAALLTACSRDARSTADSAASADSIAAAAGSAPMPLVGSAAPAARDTNPTCATGVPTPAPQFTVTFAQAGAAAQQAYTGTLQWVTTAPSRDSVVVAVAGGQATLVFQPERCAIRVSRLGTLRSRGRILGRLTLVAGQAYPTLGLEKPGDVVYWWAGPGTGADTVVQYFAAIGDTTRYFSRPLIKGPAMTPGRGDYSQVVLFHYDHHRAATGTTGAMMDGAGRDGGVMAMPAMAMQSPGSGGPNPWFACTQECCTTTY